MCRVMFVIFYYKLLLISYYIFNQVLWPQPAMIHYSASFIRRLLSGENVGHRNDIETTDKLLRFSSLDVSKFQ